MYLMDFENACMTLSQTIFQHFLMINQVRILETLAQEILIEDQGAYVVNIIRQTSEYSWGHVIFTTLKSLTGQIASRWFTLVCLKSKKS